MRSPLYSLQRLPEAGCLSIPVLGNELTSLWALPLCASLGCSEVAAFLAVMQSLASGTGRATGGQVGSGSPHSRQISWVRAEGPWQEVRGHAVGRWGASSGSYTH